MDKNKIMFYRSVKEIEDNGEQILKDWVRKGDGEHIFSAMHKESGLHMYIDEKTGDIFAPNYADWAAHMQNDEHLNLIEVSQYSEKLKQEFGYWVRKEDERIMEEYAKQDAKEMKQEIDAMNAFEPYVWENMMRKIKS